jgi:hypothetical protein
MAMLAMPQPTGVEEERIPPRNVLLGCPVMANIVSVKMENM